MNRMPRLAGYLRRRITLLAALLTVALLATGLAMAPMSVNLATSGPARLSDGTRALVGQIERPVTLSVLAPEGSPLRAHTRRLADSLRAAGLDLSLELLDPKSDRERARQYGLLRDGDTLVGIGDSFERATTPSEARIAAGLERLLRRGEQYLAWLTGHGERPVTGRTNHGHALWAEALARKGYQILPLSLAGTSAVPDNTALLVVAAPTDALRPAERRAIAEYVERGGDLLWLGEPGSPARPVGIGVRLTADPVVDPRTPERLGIEDTTTLLMDRLPEHPVTAGLDAPLVLAGASALRADSRGDWQRRPLLALTPAQQVAGADESSADGLAVTLEREIAGRPQRVAVVGDADLFADIYLGNGDNLRFGLGLVDWLTGAEDFLDTYRQGAPDQRLNLGFSGAAALAAVLLVLLPGAMLAGAWAAWRRMRRG